MTRDTLIYPKLTFPSKTFTCSVFLYHCSSFSGLARISFLTTCPSPVPVSELSLQPQLSPSGSGNLDLCLAYDCSLLETPPALPLSSAGLSNSSRGNPGKLTARHPHFFAQAFQWCLITRGINAQLLRRHKVLYELPCFVLRLLSPITPTPLLPYSHWSLSSIFFSLSLFLSFLVLLRYN